MSDGERGPAKGTTTPTSRLVVSVVAPIVAFVVLDRLIGGLAQIPDEAYHRSSFLVAVPVRAVDLALHRAPILFALSVVILLAALSVPAVRKAVAPVFEGWSSLTEGAAVRVLVGSVTLIVVWANSTYSYNAFLDQSHLADRAALVALWGLMLWRPIFVLPLVLAVATTFGQFLIPLGSFSRTESDVVVRLGILFGAFWIVRPITKDRQADTLVFLMCCLLAATFWTSGLDKLLMRWITHPQLEALVVGAYAGGWLSFLDPAAIGRAAAIVDPFSVPLMLGTLAIECGALLLLWRRWTLLSLLPLWIGFHLAVVVLCGIFFWKWILVEGALLIFLLADRRIDRMRLFGPGHFAVSVVLIIGSPWWAAPVGLSWYDTPLTYSTRLEGETESGERHALPAATFRPYAEMFVLNPFPQLSPHPRLTGAMGVTLDRDIADALAQVRDAEAVFLLEQEVGAASPEQVTEGETFDEFVASFVRTLNRGPERPLAWMELVRAPRHLWSSPRNPDWDGQEPIVNVHVTEVTTFFDGGSVREIRRRPLRVIDVQTGRSTRAEMDSPGTADRSDAG